MLNGLHVCTKGWLGSMTKDKIYRFYSGNCVRDNGEWSYPSYEDVYDYNKHCRSKIAKIKNNDR